MALFDDQFLTPAAAFFENLLSLGCYIMINVDVIVFIRCKMWKTLKSTIIHSFLILNLLSRFIYLVATRVRKQDFSLYEYQLSHSIPYYCMGMVTIALLFQWIDIYACFRYSDQVESKIKRNRRIMVVMLLVYTLFIMVFSVYLAGKVLVPASFDDIVPDNNYQTTQLLQTIQSILDTLIMVLYAIVYVLFRILINKNEDLKVIGKSVDKFFLPITAILALRISIYWITISINYDSNLEQFNRVYYTSLFLNVIFEILFNVMVTIYQLKAGAQEESQDQNKSISTYMLKEYDSSHDEQKNTNEHVDTEGEDDDRESDEFDCGYNQQHKSDAVSAQLLSKKTLKKNTQYYQPENTANVAQTYESSVLGFGETYQSPSLKPAIKITKYMNDDNLYDMIENNERNESSYMSDTRNSQFVYGNQKNSIKKSPLLQSSKQGELLMQSNYSINSDGEKKDGKSQNTGQASQYENQAIRTSSIIQTLRAMPTDDMRRAANKKMSLQKQLRPILKESSSVQIESVKKAETKRSQELAIDESSLNQSNDGNSYNLIKMNRIVSEEVD